MRESLGLKVLSCSSLSYVELWGAQQVSRVWICIWVHSKMHHSAVPLFWDAHHWKSALRWLFAKGASLTFILLRMKLNKCSYNQIICQVLKRWRRNKTMASQHMDAYRQNVEEVNFLCSRTHSKCFFFFILTTSRLLFLPTWPSSMPHSAISIQLWKDFPNTFHHRPHPCTPHSLAVYTTYLSSQKCDSLGQGTPYLSLVSSVAGNKSYIYCFEQLMRNGLGRCLNCAFISTATSVPRYVGTAFQANGNSVMIGNSQGWHKSKDWIMWYQEHLFLLLMYPG